ncbi:MAG: modA [Symbiobacteriaceae bacterium]|nr:modA [Symbiobacteriaceae bacterium]
MYRRPPALTLLLVLALLLTACAPGARPPQGAPAEVIVSAAASMTDVLTEMQKAFEAEQTAVKLKFNFGSSGALAHQIEQGAPADIFIAAGAEPMEGLVKKGLVEQSAVRTLATNKVVLIRGKAAAGVVTTWADLTSDKVRRVAIGNPAHVPAGQYGRTVLQSLSLWSALEQRLVLGEDVRQVLNFVESGEVEAGIVYSTDAAASQKVVVLAEAPGGAHPPVVYPMAVLKESRHGAQAKAFADYLASETGRQILTRYGFGQ